MSSANAADDMIVVAARAIISFFMLPSQGFYNTNSTDLSQANNEC
jgi:hypothetical protein